jgi:hypothetical protein
VGGENHNANQSPEEGGQRLRQDGSTDPDGDQDDEPQLPEPEPEPFEMDTDDRHFLPKVRKEDDPPPPPSGGSVSYSIDYGSDEHDLSQKTKSADGGASHSPSTNVENPPRDLTSQRPSSTATGNISPTDESQDDNVTVPQDSRTQRLWNDGGERQPCLSTDPGESSLQLQPRPLPTTLRGLRELHEPVVANMPPRCPQRGAESLGDLRLAEGAVNGVQSAFSLNSSEIEVRDNRRSVILDALSRLNPLSRGNGEQNNDHSSAPARMSSQSKSPTDQESLMESEEEADSFWSWKIFKKICQDACEDMCDYCRSYVWPAPSPIGSRAKQSRKQYRRIRYLRKKERENNASPVSPEDSPGRVDRRSRTPKSPPSFRLGGSDSPHSLIRFSSEEQQQAQSKDLAADASASISPVLQPNGREASRPNSIRRVSPLALEENRQDAEPPETPTPSERRKRRKAPQSTPRRTETPSSATAIDHAYSSSDEEVENTQQRITTVSTPPQATQQPKDENEPPRVDSTIPSPTSPGPSDTQSSQRDGHVSGILDIVSRTTPPPRRKPFAKVARVPDEPDPSNLLGAKGPVTQICRLVSPSWILPTCTSSSKQEISAPQQQTAPQHQSALEDHFEPQDHSAPLNTDVRQDEDVDWLATKPSRRASDINDSGSVSTSASVRVKRTVDLEGKAWQPKSTKSTASVGLSGTTERASGKMSLREAATPPRRDFKELLERAEPPASRTNTELQHIRKHKRSGAVDLTAANRTQRVDSLTRTSNASTNDVKGGMLESRLSKSHDASGSKQLRERTNIGS